MKTAAKRFAQLYLSIFIMVSGLVFAADIQSRRMDDALPKALVHGAIWPVTIVGWVNGPH